MEILEAKRIISKLSKSNAAFTDRVGNTADAFTKQAIKAQEKLLKKISQLIAESPDFKSLDFGKRVAWYAGQTENVNAMLKSSGYFDAASDFTASYKAFSGLAEKVFAAAGWDKAFAVISPEYVKFIQARDLEWLNLLGREAAEKINSTLFEMSVGGYSRGNMLSELRGVITGEYEWGAKKGLYEWHAGTYARTEASRVQQAFMNHQAEKIGAENFLYLGPADGKTRPFCAALVGDVFAKEQIMQMDNGQSGDVFSDGGGWNCRHQWIAVPADLAANIEEMGRDEVRAA